MRQMISRYRNQTSKSRIKAPLVISDVSFGIQYLWQAVCGEDFQVYLIFVVLPESHIDHNLRNCRDIIQVPFFSNSLIL